MFSRKDQLQKRTPKDGVDRKQFINLLVEEFLQTKSFDAKCQVLANLSNFAYDPINYEFLRESSAIDLFLHQLASSQEEVLTHFACCGICNLCLDPLNAQYIIKNDGINLVIKQLSSNHEETRLNAITSLIYLSDYVPKETVTIPQVLSLMIQFRDSLNVRLKNLATVFLEDVCDSNVIKKYSELDKNTNKFSEIPLPE